MNTVGEKAALLHHEQEAALFRKSLFPFTKRKTQNSQE